MLIEVFDLARGSLSLAGASSRSKKLKPLICSAYMTYTSNERSSVIVIALSSCMNYCGNAALPSIKYFFLSIYMTPL